MLPFLKKNVPADTVGLVLLNSVDWSRPATAESLKASLDLLGESADDKHFLPEFILLTAFTVDFAVTTALGEGPTTRAVLGAFYKQFEKMAKEDSLWAALFEALKSHGLTYSMAVRTGHANGLPYAAGRAFSEICGRPLSARVMLAGSVHFTSTFQGVSKVLESCKIV